MQNQHIRALALGLVRAGDRVLMAEGYDPHRTKPFYRALGGGIDFGESSLAALKREFWEELHTDLTNITYLGCIENRFTFLNQPGHEIIQLYQCDLANSHLYTLETIHYADGDQTDLTARWIECDRFQSGELWLVPEACLAYL